MGNAHPTRIALVGNAHPTRIALVGNAHPTGMALVEFKMRIVGIIRIVPSFGFTQKSLSDIEERNA